MKQSELIVLGLAAVAVWMILRSTKAGATTAKPPASNPYLNQWPTGPSGEGLF